MPQTLMHNSLHCILVTHLGFFRLEPCKTVVQLRQLLFKGVAVMSKYGMCTQSTGSTQSTVLGILGDVFCISGMYGVMLYLHDQQSVGVLGDVFVHLGV